VAELDVELAEGVRTLYARRGLWLDVHRDAGSYRCVTSAIPSTAADRLLLSARLCKP
jgi:hypothetical protein